MQPGVSRWIVGALIMLVAAAGGAAQAESTPAAVSPGREADIARIGDTCPTYSWTELPGALRYDLIVYAVTDDGRRSTELLLQGLPGGATSWTPALDKCLKPGGRYAWSVRAHGEKWESGWSVPSLFEVAVGPSEEQFQEAVEVVKSYLAARGADTPSTTTREAKSLRPADPAAVEVAKTSAEVAVTELSVDGNIDATSFTGDGSTLTGVTTEAMLASEIIAVAAAIQRECPGALGSGSRFTDCGNGAVRDNHTGLYWLKDASCDSLAGTDIEGRGQWDTAETAAAMLADGTCDLTDRSVAGSWRQPTISEFCSSWSGLNEFCDADAVSDSLVDFDANPPKIVTPAPFIGVEAAEYWSVTEGVTPLGAWHAALHDASLGSLPKTANFYVWPVRSSLVP